MIYAVRDHTLYADLLTDVRVVCGALYERKGEIYGALASLYWPSLPAWPVWARNTRSCDRTGDGAWQWPAVLAPPWPNMEFMQFRQRPYTLLAVHAY